MIWLKGCSPMRWEPRSRVGYLRARRVLYPVRRAARARNGWRTHRFRSGYRAVRRIMIATGSCGWCCGDLKRVTHPRRALVCPSCLVLVVDTIPSRDLSVPALVQRRQRSNGNGRSSK